MPLFVTVTVALGIAAPDESVTAPKIEPVATWPRKSPPSPTDKQTTKHISKIEGAVILDITLEFLLREVTTFVEAESIRLEECCQGAPQVGVATSLVPLAPLVVRSSRVRTAQMPPLLSTSSRRRATFGRLDAASDSARVVDRARSSRVIVCNFRYAQRPGKRHGAGPRAPCIERETPPGRNPTALSRPNCTRSALDRIPTPAVLTLRGDYGQAHLLADGPRDEPADSMWLPARHLHDLRQCCASGALHKCNYVSLLVRAFRLGLTGVFFGRGRFFRRLGFLGGPALCLRRLSCDSRRVLSIESRIIAFLHDRAAVVPHRSLWSGGIATRIGRFRGVL